MIRCFFRWNDKTTFIDIHFSTLKQPNHNGKSPSIFGQRIFRCGLIKDWKTRYFWFQHTSSPVRCGLIKDWKTRYYYISGGWL